MEFLMPLRGFIGIPNITWSSPGLWHAGLNPNATDLSKEKMKLMRLKSLLNILVGLLIVTACHRQDNSALHQQLYEEIHDTDKLVLASMAISKTAKLESSDWYTVGKRIAVYSYDSYMQAYMDLSELGSDDILFDDDNHVVTITLPPVRTEIVGRDMTMRREYENIGLLRSDIDSKERAEIKERANNSFKKEVAENPRFKKELTEAAERKARLYFSELLNSRGYDVELRIKN